MIKKYIPILLFASLLGACSTSDEAQPYVAPEVDPESPITLSAQVDDTEPVGTRAVITGTGTAMPISIWRADMTYSTAYGSGPHDGTITTDAKINTGLYYNSDPAIKTKLIAIHPKVDNTSVTWTVASRQVTYTTLNGYTDIICSRLTEGGRSSQMSTMTFDHLLTQIKVNVVAGANAAGKWGTINSITVANKKANCVVTLPQPNTTGTASAALSGTTSALTLTTASGGTCATTAPSATSREYGQAMFPPVTTAAALTLTIATANGTYTKTTTSQKYEAGKSYTVTLTFTATGITVSTVTISSWANGGTLSGINI